jgi:multidrug efflux pump subunit AcrB
VIDAGAVRFRPMMLTAAAVVVGSAVILFDPIFQGLAIALMAGRNRLAGALAHDRPDRLFRW